MKNVLPVTLAILLIFAVGYGVWSQDKKPDLRSSEAFCVAFTPALALTATPTLAYCQPYPTLGYATQTPTPTSIKGDTTQVFTTLSYTSTPVTYPTNTSVINLPTTRPTDTQISNTPVPPATNIPPTSIPPTDQPDKPKCNQGIGNGNEGCDPGNSNNNQDSNDEPGKRGN